MDGVSRQSKRRAFSGGAVPRLLDWRVEGFFAQLALGVGAMVVVIALEWLLGEKAPGALSATLVFPAILIASLLGGWRSGGLAAALGLLIRAIALSSTPFNVPESVRVISFALFAVASGAVVLIGIYLRWLLQRLRRSRDAVQAQSLHYRTLFETIPEGFAICDAIRGPDGRLVDYTVVEINPALQRLLNVGPEAVGARLTANPGNWTRWLQVCERALTTGEPVSFERFNRQSDLWHEVHISRITDTRMAQFFFDITERKRSEARQAEQFDELNHRVKNNLAMVSGLLQLQARGASDKTRGELLKAASRVQSIAEVHDSLSRGAAADRVDFGTYLQDLCESLKRSLAIEDRITLEVVSEPEMLSLDAAISLGMVVNELVTNAVKYAYPDGAHGDIFVGFARDEDGLVLSVRDRGPGLPEDAVSAGGLGMRLVRSLLDQLGGELSVSAEHGAWFKIRLPAEQLAVQS